MLNIVPPNRAFHLIQLCCQLLRQGRLLACLMACLFLTALCGNVSAANNAAPYGAQTVAANMVVGEVYQIVIPMRNTGTVPWTVAGNYSLVLQSPSGWNVTQISVGGTIGVNVTKSFVASVTAPSTPGVYNFQWCMDQNGAQFGTCSTPVAINVASRVQDAQFYSQNMTSPLATATRVISVSMKNTGNVPWKAGQYSLGTNDNTWGITKLTLSANVPPNTVGAFSGTITAPEPGYYKMQWQMRDPDGNSFGAPSTALDVAVAGGPPTLDVRSPTPSQPFIGNANVILVPIHAEATPTGIATISKVWVGVVNPNSHTYDVLATANGAVLDQTLRLGAYPITLVFAATDSFNKTVTKSVSIVALNDIAQITAMDFPASMVPGQRYNISITAKNSGGTTWDPKTTRLVPYNATQISNWGDFSLPLSEAVPPGGTAVFRTTVTAPANEGTVGFQMIMNEATRANFGGVAARSVSVAHPPPTVEMTAPVNRDSVDIPANTKAQVRVQGSATPGPGASIAKLELLDNNTTVLLTLPNTATVDQLVELSAGVHQLRLRATDNWNKVTYGAIASYTVLSNNATASSQIVQATMQAGKSYSTTVTMLNSGSKPWTAAAGYVLVSRHPEHWGIARVVPTTAVGAGQAYTFSVPVKAPSAAGTYDYQWSMVQDGVEAFGDPSKIVRVVVNPVAPSVPGLVAPDAGAKFVAVGSRADVRVQGSASAGEGATVSKLEVLDGATVIATASAGTIDAVVQLAGGAHALRLRATDNFNQVTTGTVVTTVTVLVNGTSAMSRNVPSPMVGGNSYPVTVVMRNTGTSTWTPADGYVLAPVAGNPNWVAAPIPVPATVAPGTDATFAFNVTAPEDPATYPFQWKLSQHGSEFGAASVAVNVTVTGQPPKVALSAPLDGSVYTAANGSAQVTVQGNASATGSATISQFTLLDNGAARINGAGNAFDKVVALPPGKHVLQLRATDSRGAVTLSNTSTVNVLHNDASLSAPSVPATMFAGQRYTLAIVVKNTGDTTWQPASAPGQGGVALAELPNKDGVWRPDGRVPLSKAVAPGETYTFNFDVVAPAKAGTYGFQWRMSDETKELFGTQITTSIVVAAAPVPTATLTASPVNQRVAPGQMGAIALTGRASEASGRLSKLEVFVDSGSGYATNPVKTVSGNTAQLDLNDSISLPGGSYRLKLRVTDEGGRYADSTPVAVNVTDSPLLGLVSGVRSTGGQQLQLVGWTCRDTSAEALTYQVYINAPANLGGTPVASGVANVGSELDDAAIQQTCHTPGVSHHFVVDLSSLLTQYPGAPLYVSASSTHGERIVLPCEDHGCRIPDGMRIGLTSPNVNNLDRFRLPMPVFARAVVTGFTGTLDEVTFNINGEWLPATAEGGGAYSVSKTGLPSNSAPYVAYAKVRQGETTLISDEHLFYVDPGIQPGEISPRTGTVVAPGVVTVLSTVVNATVEPGQSVRFYIDPKIPAVKSLRQSRTPQARMALAAVSTATAPGGTVGQGTFDGTKWSYAWTPAQDGSYEVTAKLVDGGGAVLMQTPAATIVVSSSAGPTDSKPIPVVIEPPHSTNPTAGTLPGEMTVGPSGEAVYSIPIVVPPGTAGIEPALSLAYSSTSPNGVLGMGWNLAGFSSIERCAKTIAQDGVNGRITMANSDRLCMNGQRLVVVGADGSDDAYWSAQASYRTEIDVFSRVSRLPGGGFKSEERDGKISYYGNAANSALPAQGSGAGIMKWALARTEDRRGNYLTVTYNTCSATGECQPEAMRYGGFAAGGVNREPDIAAKFEYDDARTDVQVAYIGGIRMDTAKRLTHIRTFIDTASDGSGGTLVRDYATHYTEGAVSGRSQIDWIEVSALNATTHQMETLPRTDFAWGKGDAPTLRPTSYAPFALPRFGGSDPVSRDPVQLQGDVDGSGRTSFVALKTSACGLSGEPPCFWAPIPPHVMGDVKIRAPDGTVSETKLDLTTTGFPTDGFVGATDVYMSDVNGDGYDDIILVDAPNKKWGYCINNATGAPATFSCKAGGTGTPSPVDLRGDRKAHLVGIPNAAGVASDCVYANGAMNCSDLKFSGQQEEFADAQSVLYPPMPRATAVSLGSRPQSDFYSVWRKQVPAADPANPYEQDASGKPLDVIAGVSTCINQADGIACNPVYKTRSVGRTMHLLAKIGQVGDFNGDGLSDFMYGVVDNTPDAGRIICLSKEIGVDCKKDQLFALGDSALSGNAGDFLGDGVDQMILSSGGASTKAKLCRYGAAGGFVCTEFDFAGPRPLWESNTVFLDDSGVPTVLVETRDKVDGQSLWAPMTMAAPAAMDRIVKVTNGVGHVTEVDYARGDDASVYERRPIIDGKPLTPAYPAVLTAPGVMVKQLRQANGGDGWLAKNYRYGGALADVAGRGSLGMAVVVETDPGVQIENTTYYSQMYPTVGYPLRELSKSLRGNTPVELSNTTSQYTVAATAQTTPQAQWVVPAAVTTTKNDLNGTSMGVQSVVVESYDNYGNVKKATTTDTGEGGKFSATTEMTYSADAVNWLLGLPLTVTETRVGPDGVKLTHTNSYRYKDDLLDTETVEPNTPLSVTTTHDRSNNAFGLDGVLVQSWTTPDGLPKSRKAMQGIYDAKGRFMYSVSNALDHTATIDTQAQTGLPNAVKDANGLTTSWSYDAFGRTAVSRSADKNEVRTTFKRCQGDCPTGAMLIVTREEFNGKDRISVPEQRYLNPLGRPVRISTWGAGGKEIVVDYTYDALGQLHEKYRPRFVGEDKYLETRYAYDDLGRSTSVVHVDEKGNEQESTVEFDGPRVTFKDEEKFSKTELHDVLGQLVQVTDAAGKISKMSYDAFGNLLTALDPNGNVTKSTYDNLGRRTELSDPDLGVIRTERDALGRVVKQTTPEDRKYSGATTFEYDDIDRLVRRVERDQESRWTFDIAPMGQVLAKGKLAAASTWTATGADYQRLYEYDQTNGNTSKITRASAKGNHVTSYLYDAWGRLITERVTPSVGASKSFERRYDELGDLTRIERGAVALWTVTARDASGRAIETKLGNGLVESREFDPRSGRLHSVTVSKDGKPMLVHSYGYSPRQLMSNRAVFWDTTSFVEDFTYDPLGRIKSSKIQDTLEEYRYDDAGNLTHKSNLGTGDYTYFKQGLGAGTLPHAVKTLPGDPTPFEYDLNGNLTKGAGRRFEWKSFNMPSSISKGSYSSAFVYGPEHQRVRQERTGGGDANSIEYLGSQEVESINNVVSTTRSYWPMCLGLDVDKESGDSSALWTHVDALGSVIAVSDATGTIRERLAYDTWGKRRTLNGMPENGTATPDEIDGELDRTGYTGEEMLDQLDLVHLNGRVYDPAIGRFTSADPHITDWRDGQSLNHYSYVLNSPMNYTDPSGFDAVVIIHRPSDTSGSSDSVDYVNAPRTSTSSVNIAMPPSESARGQNKRYVETVKQDPLFPNIIRHTAREVKKTPKYADKEMEQWADFDLVSDLGRAAGASERQIFWIGMASMVGNPKRLLAKGAKTAIHHICTNKNCISALAGGPWTPRFEAIFEKAGMKLEDGLNKVALEDHFGPHPELYHQIVFDRILSATEGLDGAAYRDALQGELRAIATEAQTVGTKINNLLTQRR